MKPVQILLSQLVEPVPSPTLPDTVKDPAPPLRGLRVGAAEVWVPECLHHCICAGLLSHTPTALAVDVLNMQPAEEGDGRSPPPIGIVRKNEGKPHGVDEVK